jgi:hypothetical protein
LSLWVPIPKVSVPEPEAAPLEPTELIVSTTPLLSLLKNTTGFETCVAVGTDAALVHAVLEGQSQ